MCCDLLSDGDATEVWHGMAGGGILEDVAAYAMLCHVMLTMLAIWLQIQIERVLYCVRFAR